MYHHMSLRTYSLAQIENISANSKLPPLTEEALKLINTLAEQVGAPNYVRTPVFQKDGRGSSGSGGSSRSGGGRRRGNRAKEISDEDWGIIRSFEASNIPSKDTSSSAIDQIRKSLNKISETNYQNQLDIIIGLIIDESGEVNEELITEVVNLIIKIAGGNKFYADLYAKLMGALAANFEEKVTNTVNAFAKKFVSEIHEFTTIDDIDPNTDYDAFCSQNVTNDTRRSSAVFIIALAMANVIEKKIVYEMLVPLIESVDENKDEADHVLWNEELSEVIHGCVSRVGPSALRTMADECCEEYPDPEDPDVCEFDYCSFSRLVDGVKEISERKARDYDGLSNKTVFKFMDIGDLLV